MFTPTTTIGKRLAEKWEPWLTDDLARVAEAIGAMCEPLAEVIEDRGFDGEVLLPGPENLIPNPAPSGLREVNGQLPKGWTVGAPYNNAAASIESDINVTYERSSEIFGLTNFFRVGLAGTNPNEAAGIGESIHVTEGVPVTVYVSVLERTGQNVRLTLASVSVGKAETLIVPTRNLVWNRFSVKLIPTATGLADFSVGSLGTESGILYFTAASTNPKYFDGDTPGYEWTGTPGDSVSKQVIEGYVPGYGKLFNVEECPAQFLPYLGQYVGVSIPVGTPEGEARQLVKAESGINRGTRASVESAIERQLALGTTFELKERINLADEPDPYGFVVTIKGRGIKQSWFDLKGSWEGLSGSWSDLAGDEGRVREAIESVKPAGLVFWVILAEGTPWLDLEGPWENLKGSWEEL